ncbi:MAG TPA: exonuclease [Candidatus Binatia bacterium]|nr:exonuclease [Candidatus Binatia bacterium]
MASLWAKGTSQSASSDVAPKPRKKTPTYETPVDVYFSADVETDGPIPGPYSMLSFAIVPAGRFDGRVFEPPRNFVNAFCAEVRPISEKFQEEALRVNGIDRERLRREGQDPRAAMTSAAAWLRDQAGSGVPVLVAYPLSFDWAWLYWYFIQFSETGSPFNHSRCFDLKTAYAVKAGIPISVSGRSQLPPELHPQRPHTHNALDDAIEQAEIFAKLFTWQPK